MTDRLCLAKLAEHCVYLTIPSYAHHWPRLHAEFDRIDIRARRVLGVNSDSYEPTARPDGSVLKPQSRARSDGWFELIDAIEASGWPAAMIFEDDVVFTDLFSRIDDYLAAVPDDWDVVYLGGNWNLKPVEPVNPLVYRSRFTLNTHALIIRATFLSNLRSLISKGRHNWESDVIFAQAQDQKYGNWYGLTSDMTWQAGLEGDPVTMDPLPPGQWKNFLHARAHGRVGKHFDWRCRSRILDNYESQLGSALGYRNRRLICLDDRPKRVDGEFLRDQGGNWFVPSGDTASIRLNETMSLILAIATGEMTVSEICAVFRDEYGLSHSGLRDVPSALERLGKLQLIEASGEPPAKRTYVVYGMRRSGTHAITHWLAANLTSGIRAFLHAPNDSMVTPDGLLRYFNDVDEIFQNDCPYSVFGTEDIGFDELSTEGVVIDRNVLILRDPYNMMASRIKRRGFDTTLDVRMIVSKWLEHAREFVGDTNRLANKVAISYNDWVRNKAYRDSLADAFGLINHDLVDYVPHNGGGSSFVGETLDYKASYQRRYAQIELPKAVLDKLRSEEVCHYAERIFPIQAAEVGS